MLCSAICWRKVSSALQYGCHSPKPRKPAGKPSAFWALHFIYHNRAVNRTNNELEEVKMWVISLRNLDFMYFHVLTKLFHDLSRWIHLGLCRKRRKLEKRESILTIARILFLSWNSFIVLSKNKTFSHVILGSGKELYCFFNNKEFEFVILKHLSPNIWLTQHHTKR